MIAVIGLIIGIVLGILLDPTVPAWLAPFLPVAVVAGLDALFGAGARGSKEGSRTVCSSRLSSGTLLLPASWCSSVLSWAWDQL